jgi:ferredoxin--NADP+ reductase
LTVTAKGTELNATISERHDLNEYISIVKIQSDRGEVPVFEAGQYITLGLPERRDDSVGDGPEPPRKSKSGLVRRAYSIASSPLVRDSMEVFVVLVQQGELTEKLWTLGEGDRLWMAPGVKGQFTLNDALPDKDLVMVSTGTGIAPFMSMLRTYRGQNRWRRFVLINGVRLAQDLGYVDELDALCREDATITYIPMVTREPEGSDWAGLRGRVQGILEPVKYQERVGAPLDAAECHVYLCGNPAMIDTVEPMLHGLGFKTHSPRDPGNLHFERYW